MKFSKLLFTFLFLASVNVFAFPSPDEMRNNYQICQNEEGWNAKWGRYVVAFSNHEAARVCNNPQNSPSRPALMGCHSSNGFLYAGYYCQDIGFDN